MGLLERLLGELPEEDRRSSLAPSSLFKDPAPGDFGYDPSTIDLTKHIGLFDTSNIADMSQMFKNQPDTTLDLSKFSIEKDE